MGALEEVVGGRELTAGLSFGAGALIAGLLIRALWTARSKRPAPVAGALVAVAACAALMSARELPDGLLYGVALLAAAGLVDDFTRAPPLLRLALAAPGAWVLVTRNELGDAGWTPTVVLVSVVIGAALCADFDRRYRDDAFGPVLLAISALGVYLTVPDTEDALVLLGVALPLALLGWPKRLCSLGSAGSFAAVGLIGWTAAVGSVGRPAALVGALGCLGLLVAEPVVRLLRLVPRWASPLTAFGRGTMPTLAVGAVHLAVVIVAARLAGPASTVTAALPWTAVQVVVSVTVLLALGRSQSQDKT